ncbi:MAG TPA: hypothetical protein PKM09_02375 [Bacillota bacterium]|jgi:hypothetical protein|nr:hypothetical protein [Bacillota bacterium]HOI36036.1 hypothetical protein [Bacillota bacterium]HPU75463.1 hypothetical protein [Bacillota bacterium]
MEVREDAVVPLGYGKYVRADRIIALVPIEDDRGPGRRTKVYVEQLPSPLVASRTENSILASMVRTPTEVLEATAALELIQDLLDDIGQVGPMLRKSIKDEAGLDLDELELKVKEILAHELDAE